MIEKIISFIQREVVFPKDRDVFQDLVISVFEDGDVCISGSQMSIDGRIKPIFVNMSNGVDEMNIHWTVKGETLPLGLSRVKVKKVKGNE